MKKILLAIAVLSAMCVVSAAIMSNGKGDKSKPQTQSQGKEKSFLVKGKIGVSIK